MPQLLYPPRKRPWYPLIRRMDVLKHHSGYFSKEKTLLQLPQIKSQFFDSLPHSLVIIPIYNILNRSHFRDVNIKSVGAISWDVTGLLFSEHKLLQKCHSASTSTTDKSSETFKYPQKPQGERTTVVMQPPHVQNTNIYCGLLWTEFHSSDRRQCSGSLLQNVWVTELKIIGACPLPSWLSTPLDRRC